MKEYITGSELRTHAQCPYMFDLRYHQGYVPMVKRSSEVFGSYMHLTINKYLKGEVENPQGFFTSIWDKEKEFLVYPDRENGELLKSIGLEILEQIPSFVKTLGKILEVEQPYEGVLLGGTPIKGTPDFIVEKDGKKILFDWKIVSSTPFEGKEKIDPQLKVYSYLTGVEDGAFIFVKRTRKPTIIPPRITKISPKEEDVMLWAEQGILMEEGPFYKNVSFFCGMCEYLPLCAGDPEGDTLFIKKEVPDRYAGISCKSLLFSYP